ncbi:MAG TPA: mechanosensitive ion channel family protein [Acidobacteriota bacterium]|nr:mechanosensitive ion channel family protein [Acidobacteriota bacterium]
MVTIETLLANHYFRAGIIMAIVLLIVRPVLFSFEKIVLLFTRKTKTDLDDIFVKKTYRPFSSIFILVGLRVAINELPLPAMVELACSRTIFSIIAMIVAMVVYRFVDIILIGSLNNSETFKSRASRKSLVSLILNTLKVVLCLISIIVILNIWGVQIAPFLAGLGIAGIAVALAIQPTLANIFAGVAMILDKTIKEGDLIYLDSTTKGTIQSIGLRSTRLVTFDNELIIIPNSKLADGMIQNIALPEPMTRAVVVFTVAYGVDVERVKSLILAQIKAIPHVMADPKPSVRFTSMKDFALEFKAYFYVESYQYRFPAIDEANSRIYETLTKHKIEIPYPQLDVMIRKKRT